jgi:molybdate transport system substrate-binding protein
VLGAHPQLRLVRSATKFGGGLPANHAPAEEPFIPLLHVIRVRIGNVVIRNDLLRLRVNNRRRSGANQDECDQSQERERAESGDEGHLPVSKAAEGEAIQKRQERLASDHFGKKHFPFASQNGPQCLYNLLSMSRSNVRTRIASFGIFISHALLAGCILLSAASASAQENKTARELTVAAAADLSTALKEIGDLYQKKSGVQVKLSFGASGALTQQMKNDAPFDLFFSADMDYPRRLISSGAADGTTLYQYAIGKLVLWVPADSPLDVEYKGMDVLLDPSVKKIAIANPQHAPYGRAAVAALKHAGVYDRIVDRLVMGESVSQAAQFAESGNAQAGFVALAHAVAPGMRGQGKYWQVPADFYPPLTQGAVVLSHSQHKKEAKDFLEFIKTKEAGDVLQKYGFTLSS